MSLYGFHGQLRTLRLRNTRSPSGRPCYQLLEPFAWNNENYYIECELGFVTDFASIPHFIPWVNPRDGKWRHASVIHDKACILARDGKMTYKDADTILYYAMLDDNASKFSASFFYFWCRTKHLLWGQG